MKRKLLRGHVFKEYRHVLAMIFFFMIIIIIVLLSAAAHCTYDCTLCTIIWLFIFIHINIPASRCSAKKHNPE